MSDFIMMFYDIIKSIIASVQDLVKQIRAKNDED